MKERCKQLMLGTFKTKDIHCSRHSELRTPHCAFVPGGVLLAQDGSSRSAVAARRKTHVAGEDVPILDVVLGKSMTSIVSGYLGTLEDGISKLLVTGPFTTLSP